MLGMRNESRTIALGTAAVRKRQSKCHRRELFLFLPIDEFGASYEESMVPERGLEPAVPYENQLLNPNWMMCRRPPRHACAASLCVISEMENPSATRQAHTPRIDKPASQHYLTMAPGRKRRLQVWLFSWGL
jgi:hypothetical protein